MKLTVSNIITIVYLIVSGFFLYFGIAGRHILDESSKIQVIDLAIGLSLCLGICLLYIGCYDKIVKWLMEWYEVKKLKANDDFR